MKSWYNAIARDPNDLSPVVEAIAYFDAQHLEAREELENLTGQRLMQVQARLPGIVEYRYQQLTELEAILSYLEIREDAAVGKQRLFYVEVYARKLTDRMVDKFAECHPDVIIIRELRNHVTAVRNRFVALSRGHEYLHFQLGNITKLRIAGLDDAIL